MYVWTSVCRYLYVHTRTNPLFGFPTACDRALKPRAPGVLFTAKVTVASELETHLSAVG